MIGIVRDWSGGMLLAVKYLDKVLSRPLARGRIEDNLLKHKHSRAFFPSLKLP